jgi:hypothetical protein
MRAIDFFHVLDTVRYAELKKQLINNWAAGTENLQPLLMRCSP